MMEGLQTFESEQFGAVRTVEENGIILFCAVDVASILEYANPQKAIRDHCREDGVTFRSVIDNMGRMQTAKFIDEGNLYRLIVHSKLPTAEQFERWVFDEVLPTIRQTGRYRVSEIPAGTVLAPEPHDYIQAARIIASCPKTRLTMVIGLLENAGLKVPKAQELPPAEISRFRRSNAHPVGQYAKDGTLVEIYESVREAERQTGVSAAGICRVCSGEKQYAGGYAWKKEEME